MDRLIAGEWRQIAIGGRKWSVRGGECGAAKAGTGTPSENRDGCETNGVDRIAVRWPQQ